VIYNCTDQVKSLGNTQGEAFMRQFTLAAATIAIAALVAAAPASAERLMGGPIKQGGQCWKSNSGGGESTWGTWTACPQKAATPATRPAARNRT
jgi:hypothetical protein